MFWIRNPLKQTKFANLKLTKEQRKFIKFALAGNNVLVDACIGSGKTTSIQCLCDLIPKEKQIVCLFLTKKCYPQKCLLKTYSILMV